ncbi:MAG: DMT family transporter [Dorea sp.]
MLKKIIWLFPVLSGIFWGSVGVFVRYLKAAGMNSFTIVESRIVMAVLILAIWILIYDKSMFKIRIKDSWIFCAASLFGMLGINLTYNEAINRISLSLAAVLLSLSPVYVLILAAILFGEKITKKKVVCVAMAVGGCVLVSGIFEQAGGIQLDGFGILLGGLAGFCYALYSIFSKKAMDLGYHGFTITLYCLIVIAVVLFPIADWSAIGAFAVAAPVKHGIFYVVHALVSSVMPYILYTVSLNYMETGKASILAAGEPVAAMVFGAVFFDENPTMLALLGLIVTLVALTILSMPEKNINKKTE